MKQLTKNTKNLVEENALIIKRTISALVIQNAIGTVN